MTSETKPLSAHKRLPKKDSQPKGLVTVSDSSALDRELEQLRRKHRIPGLAAAVYLDGQMREAAACGLRKAGSRQPVSKDDKWRIGSCTKSMTATLAGILIEQGRIDWMTTIGETFEPWRHEIHHHWHRVTLEQLLCHHSGASRNGGAYSQRPSERTGTAREQRLEFARRLLANAPELPPNRRFEYSNAGYGIAGLMLETCTDRSWESLMNAFVFQPLGMTSAGFNDPSNEEVLEHPIGHDRINGKMAPIDPDSRWISPAAVGPAATINCSIEDFLKFAASHAGKSLLVSDTTLHRLHRRYGASEYSPGWFVLERTWGRGYVICHSGNSWGWNATMWIAPLRNVAFVAASNYNGQAAANACNQAINQMIVRLL